MQEKMFSLFEERAKALSAEVFFAADVSQAREIIGKTLADLGNPVIGVAQSDLVNALGIKDLAAESGMRIYDTDLPKFAEEFTVGISEVDLGIAETGSIAQDATDLGKRVISMLTDVHIAVLKAENITPGLKEAVHHFHAGGKPQGYLAFISGPSRTADIERVLTIGVHGPERLVIVVIN